ncbi:MAG TPA: PrsW family glutamic-type intramembrane protease [Lentimicrobium sp.]|nr:PrsW family glutamic-type intramembrane protease [Lentimicrobium sp.]
MLLIAISTLPVVIILGYVYYRDKYEKEPLGLLIKTFMGGILSAIVTLVVLTPLDGLFPVPDGILNNAIIKAFAWAAIPEELFKFMFLYWIVWKNRNFNENYDGIVYAVFVSLGFACLENIFYVFQHGAGVGIMRGILAVPAHALFGVIMGYYFSIARFSFTSTFLNLAKSLLYAIFAHGIYDFLIFWYAGSVAALNDRAWILIIVFLVFIVFLWRLGFRKIRHHVSTSVFK